ncbi:MAG: 30S ribosomal protein S6 [Anaerolineae bacterium]|nr:30S ribosomal protein S6 [Anaerolineae bacterium]
MKRPYELAFVFRILSTDDETQAALDQVISWIEGENKEFGNVTRIDRSRFGRRKLAYEIDGQRDGLYIIISADVDPNHLPELELNLKVFTPVLRHLVIRDEDTEKARRKSDDGDKAAVEAEEEPAPVAEAAAEEPVAEEEVEEVVETEAEDSAEEDDEESES